MIPNGELKEPGRDPCRHPEQDCWQDPESGEVACQQCGEVQPVSRRPLVGSQVEIFDRSPKNFAVFRNNLGSTSKSQPNAKAPEPYHQLAIANVRGSGRWKHRPLALIVKTCPRCKEQQNVAVYGEPVTCQNEHCGAYLVKCDRCGAQNITKELKKLKKCSSCKKTLRKPKVEFVRTRLAERVTRWLPVDPAKYGMNTSAVGYMSDLRLLEKWDPPEDSFAFQKAKELFSQRFDGQLSDDIASFLAARYMKAVRQLLTNQRNSLPAMLEGLLESVIELAGVNS